MPRTPKNKLDCVIGKQARPSSLEEKRKDKPKEKVLEEERPLDGVTLLSLPDKLRKTALVLLKLGRANAAGIARETGRGKDTESMCLKQLFEMGYVKMEKQAHDVYFYV